MDKILTFALDENRFLSNFYPYRDGGGFYPHPVKVVYDEMVFDCVECAYQAAKTLDMEMRAEIQAMTPFEAKKLADSGRLKLRPEWDNIKIAVMADLVSQKFANSPALKEMLLATGDAELEDGNHRGDCFWGVCAGIGQNNLGKILMRLRDKLKQE